MLTLVAAILAAYSNSFTGALVLDDVTSIQTNTSIHDISKLASILSPPRGTTVEGRPVANLSLAVNYAAGGTHVLGYHVVNLGIHAGAALLLWGIVRRTLARDGRFSDGADAVAWVVAGLWALHPLQTESVTYIVQRVESLMGFFYLLTLYSFIRSVDGNDSRGWMLIGILACWLGMGTKEVMVSAPLLVLLYDRTVIAESFAGALRQRWVFHGALFSSWLLLGWLLWASWERQNSTGFGAGVSAWHYFLTQCRAIGIYLRLSFWPDNLVFDYGRGLVRDPWMVLPQGTLLIGMAFLTVWVVVRRHLLGVAGAWFFATLAPSSSIVPVVTQTTTEHRMYLALVGVVAVVVAGVGLAAGRCGMACLALCVPALGLATYQRNALYRDPVKLWQDTVDKQPGNSRARNNLGNGLVASGRANEALVHFEAATTIGDYINAELHANHALAYNALDRYDEAEVLFKKALELDARYYKALTQLGNIEMKRGRVNEAVELFQQSLLIAPESGVTRTNLGSAYLALGEMQKAASEYRRGLISEGRNVEAWTGLGNIAFTLGQLEEAAECYRKAIEEARGKGCVIPLSSLGNVYTTQERFQEAEAAFARALAMDPTALLARQNFASMLAKAGRFSEAASHFEMASEQAPEDPVLRGNLAMAYELSRQREKAMNAYEEALRLDPNHPFARIRLNELRHKGAGMDLPN